MSGRGQICLVTTGHPSTNPRLVKEADALVDAGYNVHVIACKFLDWADKADAEFTGRPWRLSWVRFGAMASPPNRHFQRARRAGTARLAPLLDFPLALTIRALHYVVPELARKARAVPADLYIAHNLAALPAAYTAAKRHQARLGFDAEDFHRGEFPDGDNSLHRRLTIKVENAYIPKCDYVTAASDGIAEAYVDALGITRPKTILNVFPLADREVILTEDERRIEKPDGIFSLYWFSQTIGPGRGLEDVVRALADLPPDVYLSLRGRWAVGYQSELFGLAEGLGVADRVRSLEPEHPREMVMRASMHDIGLALEPGRSENNRIAVSNKLFTYTLAGIPCIATDTPGQRGVSSELKGSVYLYPYGNVSMFAHTAREIRRAVRREQLIYAAQAYSWDNEKVQFLRTISAVMA